MKGNSLFYRYRMNSFDDLDNNQIDLTIVAVNNIDATILLDEKKLFETFLTEDKEGNLGLESLLIDGYVNLKNLLKFLLGSDINLTVLSSNGNKKLFDLTAHKGNCISFETLELRYQEWITVSKRENSMDEYGSLLGLIGYIQTNKNKKHLVLITEKRKHGT